MSTRELVVYIRTPDREPIVGREVTCVLKEPDVFEEKIVQATRPFREVTDSDGRVAFDLIPSSMLDNQTKYLVNWLDLDEPYEIFMSEVDSTLATLVGETGTFSRDNLIAGDNITLTFVGNESVRIAFSGQAGGDDEFARAAAEAARAIADAAVVVNTQQTVDIDAAKAVADAAVVVNTQQAIDIDAAKAVADGAVAVNVVQQAEIDAIGGGGGTIGIDRELLITSGTGNIAGSGTSYSFEADVDLLPDDDLEIELTYPNGVSGLVVTKARAILDLVPRDPNNNPANSNDAKSFLITGSSNSLFAHQISRLFVWNMGARMWRFNNSRSGSPLLTVHRSRPVFVPAVTKREKVAT